jgi:hypothetical protein
LNLTPDLTNRLAAIRSLLALGDIDLVSVAAMKLEPMRGEPALGAIIDALAAHRYTEADQLIGDLLSSGVRLAEWTDPEVALLEAELTRVTAELADLETEQAELEHQMARFHAAHAAALGDRIATILRGRLEILKRRMRTDASAAEKMRAAEQEFREFTQDHETRRKEDARTEWKLSAEEQQEMRNLFRSASRKCHPDLAAQGQEDAAAAMFREVRKAYEEGDLGRLRSLAAMAGTGFTPEGSRGIGRSDQLKARIAAVRDAMARTGRALSTMKESETYRIMTTCGDYAAFFAEQAAILDEEIAVLSSALENDASDELT